MIIFVLARYNMKRFLFSLILVLLALHSYAHERTTVAYAQRDSCTLYMDIYTPDKVDSSGITVLYMFGGGFLKGDKREEIEEWFKILNDRGFNVVSIDYRLGLKGANLKGLAFIKSLDNAIDMAVEDLFSATLFLINEGAKYGIDANKLVLTGSSAGAMAVLQGEYEICNGGALAAVLPQDYNYCGVIPFAGAVFDNHNPLRFATRPCPILLFHGIEDHLVPYKKIAVFNMCFGGSNEVAKVLKKQGWPCSIYRYEDRGHEVSIYGVYCAPMFIDFIESRIIGKSAATFDATVNDPASPNPAWGREKPKALYHN